MLKSIHFISDYRTWKKGDIIPIEDRVTILVGDQGTGKSSLLQALRNLQDKFHKEKQIKIDCPDSFRAHSFDFEKDNPRVSSYFSEALSMQFQVGCRFASHGEINNAVIKWMEASQITEKDIFFMDEPDTALSIRSIATFIAKLKQCKAQVILSTHNIQIMEAFGKVYSVEHKKWMKADEFILTQFTDPPPVKTTKKHKRKK